MLEMPQRSVTRFFIPMIDVLTLLFCIYLLMPIAAESGSGMTEAERQASAERVRDLEAELARKGEVGEEARARLRQDLELLRKEKGEALRKRLSVRVLEIDDRTGKLYFRDNAGRRVEVRNENDANDLINADRREQGLSRRELYYLILYPRDRASGFPERRQRLDYDRWFKDVALGYDIPGGPGEGS